MTKDLKDQLDEMGHDYYDVVNKLLRSPEISFVDQKHNGWMTIFKIAATIAAILAFAVFFFKSTCETENVYTARVVTGVEMYRLAYSKSSDAIDRILETQAPNGSWQNDFLTQQNAAALKEHSHDNNNVRIAYLRAARYLRSKGLSPKFMLGHDGRKDFQ
jgi:hypothetical protein